jgi:hypothetical protein
VVQWFLYQYLINTHREQWKWNDGVMEDWALSKSKIPNPNLKTNPNDKIQIRQERVRLFGF